MSSLFAARLGTNYSPNDHEILEIRSLLVQPTHRLEQLDDKIAELQKAIDKLSEERSGVATYIDAHQALLSPVRRMPPSIMKEIFIACLPTDRNCAMSASEAPILLGRICSAWRTISLSTPPLWARLHVEDPYIDVSYCLLRHPTTQDPLQRMLIKRVEVVKEWLGRSSPHPLSISLVLNAEYTKHAPILFAALREYSTRWQRIHFDIPLALLRSISEVCASDVPMLQSIVLDYAMRKKSGGTAGTDWDTWDIFRARNLSSVGVFGLWYPVRLPLPWSRLRNLSLHEVTPHTNMNSNTALAIISKCTNLSRFDVMIGQHSSHHTEFSVAKSTSLQSLSLRFSTLPHLTFLNQLELPNLRELRLLGSAQYEDPPSFTQFFSVSSQVENIYLDTQLFSMWTLTQFFHALPPTLKCLGIEDSLNAEGWGRVDSVEPKFDDQMLGLLAPNTYGGPVLCPELQCLTVKSCLLVSDAAVLQFIRARMEIASGPSLKRVSFQFSRQKTLDIQAELQLSMEAGVDVSLVYPPHSTGATSPSCQFLISDDIWE